MKQLTQKLKSGEMTIQELPMPIASEGKILVRNHYSVISAGTESTTVKTARKSLIGKAKERPEDVKRVIDTIKQQGPVQTYRAVMKKLDAYSPLGYSSAGEVIEVGPDITEFAVGDKVGCAGIGYANHAEVVCVPKNLCVKLPEDADLKKASYNTLGAIAMQGIRQADLRLGESCAVIGLGFLGQLTCIMLQASGVLVYGIDIDPRVVETARKHCVEQAWTRSDAGMTRQIEIHTAGLGVDAVIITAETSSLDPINLAGEIARKKGRVIVVGAVPTGFNRDPHYYKKELELRMSCSYGPGRYDINYEEKGVDYPAAYVRWTEKRNMQAFQQLLHTNKINIDYLTTHEFSFDDAPKAYDMIVTQSEPFLGVLLKYDVDKPLQQARIKVHKHKPAGKVGIAFIGAGSYAQSHLLPNLPRNENDVVLKAVMTQSGTTSKRVAERFGFEFCTSDRAEILNNKDINTIFIATRHDTHAAYVNMALEAGKHIFVEKPLCLNQSELNEIEKIYSKKPEAYLMVGFNRRFSLLTRMLKEKLGDGPVSMIYRVNAGSIPSDCWIQDPTMGGGRIIGEVCHFIDFLTFINSSLPTRVYASAFPDPKHLNDTVNINIEFSNGSIGTICYFANGSQAMSKEYIEVYKSGLTSVISDFKELSIYSSGKPFRKKLINQDKGQAFMVKKFIDQIKCGGEPSISPDEILAATKTTFAICKSLQNHRSVSI